MRLLPATGIGGRLRELRLARGLTGRQLAEKAGLQQHQISDVELGRISPRLSTVEKIAAALDAEIRIVER